MTLDGFCDHTAVRPDGEVHDHYTNLLANAGVVLYGRKTYELMQFWQTLIKNPSGNKSLDDFAQVMDKVPKIVFSKTLNTINDWQSASLAEKSLEDEINYLKRKEGKDIYIGSPGLIVQAANLHLIDEYQIMVHPTVVGEGLLLFKNLQKQVHLQLVKTKSFKSGAIVLYYHPES